MEYQSSSTTQQHSIYEDSMAAAIRNDSGEIAEAFSGDGNRRELNNRPRNRVFGGERGSRGWRHSGPPPRGAFPNRRGRGRVSRPPFSVDAEEFVPRNWQKAPTVPNGKNWEDAPEFIPASQQQPQYATDSGAKIGKRDETTGGEIAENSVPFEGPTGGASTVNGELAGTTGDDAYVNGAAARQPPGTRRRTDASVRGRGRGSGGGRHPQQQQRRQQAGANDARNRNWREPEVVPPGEGESAEGADGSFGGSSSNNSSGRGRDRQWAGGGAAPRQVGSGRFADTGGRRAPTDWQGYTAAEPVERRRTWEQGRNRNNRMGPTQNGNTDQGEWEPRNESRGEGPDITDSNRRNPRPVDYSRSDAGNWRGIAARSNQRQDGESRDCDGRERQPKGGGKGSPGKLPDAEIPGGKRLPADGSGPENTHSTRNRTAQPKSFRGAETSADSGHRERLSTQLSRGTLECLVCCERVRPRDAVWSCPSCHHVLHLNCTRRWARSSKPESGGWPCPACRHEVPRVPTEYRCWCGKRRDPEWSPFEVPHSCGDSCGKLRQPPGGDPDAGCTHRCTLRCHPGPCPPCVVQVNRSCGCGRESRLVVCGQTLCCGAVCDRTLACGKHRCECVCHPGPCAECEVVEVRACWCGKTTREVACTSEEALLDGFSCDGECGRPLSCGNHCCADTCHRGPCAPCPLSPELITHCPCGKVALRDMQGVDAVTSTSANQSPPADECADSLPTENVEDATGFVRKSCLDPVPTCGGVCGKRLSCGQPSSPHTCAAACHSGPCPPCPLTTSVKCRCGNLDKELPCVELTTRADDARCSRRCTKKRACGKHKCGQECCIEQDHPCPLVCNHLLSCGRHRCEDLCHRGNCRPCLQSSFDELTCECGAEVIEPPVPCGTRRPACFRPCSREHPCGHAPTHVCHAEPSCPPCTILVQRWCYGRHELRKAVPCHQTEVSCGRPCGKELPCGRHSCVAACHAGPCADSCTQPCTRQRQLCGHACAAPCHDGPCPETPCREMVVVTCECGHRSTTRPCAENFKEYRRIATSLLAAKMTDVHAGRTVDLTDLSGSPRGLTLKTLECNDECKIVERSRRLAIALQIRNPDLSAKLTPRYSDFMRQWGKKDPAFCAMVHDRLTELVKLAKESKQKSRSYSFDPMNRDKRHFIHEYCEHFGCESVAYDQEPKRNIVATASREKAWLPSMGLLEVLQRESGLRKIPKPVLTPSNRSQPTARTMEVLTPGGPQPQTSDADRESTGWVGAVGAGAPSQPDVGGTS